MQLPAEVHEWWKALQKQAATDENGAGFADIPAKTVAETYETAKKGRLGALWPETLRPVRFPLPQTLF